ncbi:diguanylate cyclase [Psychromonas sp.]|nr:diguanylate cyclase [Psychromonas sp.]
MQHSLKKRIVLLFSIGLFSALFITASVFTIELQHRYKELLIHIGQTAADQLSYKTEKLIRLGLIPEEFTGYQKLLEETLNPKEGIIYVALINTKNKAIFEAGNRPENFTDTEQWKASDNHSWLNVFSTIEPSILSIAIALDEDVANRKTFNFIKTSLIYSILIALIVILALTIFLNIHLGRPVKKLVEQIQQTNLNNAESFKNDTLTRSDELGVIARAFSELMQKLSLSQHSLKQSNTELKSITEELEKRVLERTKEVESMNKKLKNIAHIDSLTGLMNRFSFDHDFNNRFDNAKRHERNFIILLADLDGFKDVNDSFGHAAGDHALKIIGSRLRTSFTYGHSVYRIGGDEFVILIDENIDQTELISLIVQLRRLISKPIFYEEELLPFGVSVGAVNSKNQIDSNAKQLLRHADKAMYEAKNQGVDYIIK